MTDRERILGRLPNSGAVRELQPAFPFPNAPGDLLERFLERFEFHSGRIISQTELAQFCEKKCAADPDTHHFLDRLGLHLNQSQDPAQKDVLWETEIGITTAVCAVAETGSLVLSSGAEKRRLLSLVCPVHIMLITLDQIVPTLDDAIKLMSGRTHVIITGPSRTADIEGVMVHGVHGPRDVLVHVAS